MEEAQVRSEHMRDAGGCEGECRSNVVDAVDLLMMLYQ
jgi:hypothetical protein